MTTPDNRAMTRELSQLKLDLAAATRQIDKLKKDNDDLTSQVRKTIECCVSWRGFQISTNQKLENSAFLLQIGIYLEPFPKNKTPVCEQSAFVRFCRSRAMSVKSHS